MYPFDLATELGPSTLRCRHVYDDYVLQGTIVYRLPNFILQSTRLNWTVHKSEPLHGPCSTL